MLQFDANLSILFGDRPLAVRPAAAAAAGFDAVESWWPFEAPVPPQRDVAAFIGAVRDAGLTLACLNFDGGDFAAGERGLLALPAAARRFRDNIPVAVEIARALGCRRLNALYGNRSPELDRGLQDGLALENLALAADAAAAIGAMVVVEALNPAEHPAYGLGRIDDAADLADRLAATSGRRIGVLLDVYHVARAGDDVVAAIERHGRRLGHVQIADVPGRGQPGSGTLPFDRIFEALEAVGYDGWVGLEYLPGAAEGSSFAWLPPDRRRSANKHVPSPAVANEDARVPPGL